MLPNSAITVSKRFVTAKVRVEDEETMQRSLFTLTDSQGLLTKLEEIYFRVPAGQLKLRLAHPGKDIGSLIASSRQQITHNQSYKLNILEVRVSDVSAGSNQLRHTLALVLDELAILRKNRRTFTLGHSVHVHLDDVEELGTFMDIEVHPSHAGESDDQMFNCAEDLLRRLNIASGALVSRSYLELYLREQQEGYESENYDEDGEQRQQNEQQQQQEEGEGEEESDESAFSDESVPSLRSRTTTF
ncbi:hypothetical protein niasHT_032613 [Heterodera trifolii]|uniref:CYTH domain-containing protein n=1 Tax=Heterodera trifolii TaxID=157864 RepID=A0ABD2IEV2_9BILA